MVNKNVLIGWSVVIALLLVGVAASQRDLRQGKPSAENTSAAPATVVPSDWQTFRHDQMKFAISYPSSVKLNQDGAFVSFFQYGSTQTMGSAVHDGLIVNIMSQAYPGGNESLKAFVEQQLQGDSENGNIAQPVTPISINGYQGLTYTLEGQGRYQIIILPQDNDRVLMISYLAADPDNRGYAQTVEQMFSTLELMQ